MRISWNKTLRLPGMACSYVCTTMIFDHREIVERAHAVGLTVTAWTG
jgi:hypothetical protein